jgi:hypothetical protein
VCGVEGRWRNWALNVAIDFVTAHNFFLQAIMSSVGAGVMEHQVVDVGAEAADFDRHMERSLHLWLWLWHWHWHWHRHRLCGSNLIRVQWC